MTHAMLAIMMSFVLAERDPLCPKFKEVRGSDSHHDANAVLIANDAVALRKIWCRHIGGDPTNAVDLKAKPDLKVDFEKQLVVCVFCFDKELPRLRTAWSQGKRVARLICILKQTGVEDDGDSDRESEADRIKPCYFVMVILPKQDFGGLESAYEYSVRSKTGAVPGWGLHHKPLAPNSVDDKASNK